MEKRIIVLYKSSTGFTKRYAEMIAAELRCDLAEFKTMDTKRLTQYNTVIFGTRAFAEGIDGFQKAKTLCAKSGIESLILFVTGATPNENQRVLEAFWKRNLTEGELTALPHFYMQAGLCYEKLSLRDKLMLKTAAAVMRRKKNKTPDELQFEKAISSSYDISSRTYIMPLVTYIREQNIE